MNEVSDYGNISLLSTSRATAHHSSLKDENKGITTTTTAASLEDDILANSLLSPCRTYDVVEFETTTDETKTPTINNCNKKNTMKASMRIHHDNDDNDAEDDGDDDTSKSSATSLMSNRSMTKLDLLRARNKLIRKKGSKKIAHTRLSLANSCNSASDHNNGKRSSSKLVLEETPNMCETPSSNTTTSNNSTESSSSLRRLPSLSGCYSWYSPDKLLLQQENLLLKLQLDGIQRANGKLLNRVFTLQQQDQSKDSIKQGKQTQSKSSRGPRLLIVVAVVVSLSCILVARIFGFGNNVLNQETLQTSARTSFSINNDDNKMHPNNLGLNSSSLVEYYVYSQLDDDYDFNDDMHQPLEHYQQLLLNGSNNTSSIKDAPVPSKAEVSISNSFTGNADDEMLQDKTYQAQGRREESQDDMKHAPEEEVLDTTRQSEGQEESYDETFHAESRMQDEHQEDDKEENNSMGSFTVQDTSRKEGDEGHAEGERNWSSRYEQGQRFKKPQNLMAALSSAAFIWEKNKKTEGAIRRTPLDDKKRTFHQDVLKHDVLGVWLNLEKRQQKE